MKKLLLVLPFLSILAVGDNTPQPTTAAPQNTQNTAQPAKPTTVTAAPAAAATTATETAAAPPEGTVERWKVGITGGMNMANFGRDLTGASNRMGIMGGIYFQYRVGEKLFIAPTLSYLQKGYSDASYTVSSDYLEIPLQIIWKPSLNQSETFKLRVFFGPTFGYQLMKNQTGASATSTDPGLKTIDFGAFAGLGGEYNLTKTNIFLDIRYIYGLANINDTNSATTRNSSAAYSTAGILFNLGAYWSL